ncbi:helix-turn-helix transcriptional regulator [Dehalogenimonas sp. THU2]|uniref:helix-turn-helix domain-containing protein n=1 Tax=Dehalogenimonas sp. THU2 TaxID=3151121 RepID=UPI003218845E
MNSRNIIGERLRQARNNSKPRVTQEELAARLQVMDIHIDRAKVAKIESGIRPVYDYELAAIAKALKIDVRWLIEGK